MTDGFPSAREELFYLGYAEGASAIDFFVRTYGQEKLVQLIRSYAAGVTDDEAFEAATGEGFAAFEAAWLADLGASAPTAHGPQEAERGPDAAAWVPAAPIDGRWHSPTGLGRRSHPGVATERCRHPDRPIVPAASGAHRRRRAPARRRSAVALAPPARIGCDRGRSGRSTARPCAASATARRPPVAAAAPGCPDEPAAWTADEQRWRPASDACPAGSGPSRWRSLALGFLSPSSSEREGPRVRYSSSERPPLLETARELDAAQARPPGADPRAARPDRRRRGRLRPATIGP